MCETTSRMVKIEDFNFICRLCLNKDPTIRPILIKTDKDIKAGINENIVKRIFACTNIQIYPNDGLPKYLCSTCLNKLNNCFLFRNQCLESDKVLQKLIEQQDEEFMKNVCVASKHSISDTVKQFENPENIPQIYNTIEMLKDKYDENSDKDEDINSSEEDNKYKNSSESENNTISDSQSASDTEIKSKRQKRTKSKDELPENKEQKRKRSKIKKIDVCPICGKITKSLSQHMHSHGKKKNKYKCEECEREFTQRDTFNDHMNTHTGSKPYKCTICAKEYHSSQSLRFHLAIHGDKKYDCDICNKTFSYSSSLRAHKQTHTQDRKHGCSYCEKMFLTRSKLKNHLRIHTGERPYQCEYCSKSFTSSYNLSSHKEVHLKERPYKCLKCEMDFAYPTQLKKHNKACLGGVGSSNINSIENNILITNK